MAKSIIFDHRCFIAIHHPNTIPMGFPWPNEFGPTTAIYRLDEDLIPPAGIIGYDHASLTGEFHS
jgi:hypothetical protein